MIQVRRRNYRAHYQSFHLQTFSNVFTRFARVYDGVSYRKLEILADVRVQTHHVVIPDCFFFVLRDLIVKTQGFGLTSVQGVSNM